MSTFKGGRQNFHPWAFLMQTWIPSPLKIRLQSYPHFLGSKPIDYNRTDFCIDLDRLGLQMFHFSIPITYVPHYITILHLLASYQPLDLKQFSQLNIRSSFLLSQTIGPSMSVYTGNCVPGFQREVFSNHTQSYQRLNL